MLKLQIIFINAWLRRSAWLMLLLPLELVYRFLNYINWLVKTRILSRHSLKVPLIVVGSITLGGAGKTPAVISLAKELTAMGFKVGIISRGYKGNNKQPTEISTRSHPNEIGDEPLLIACATDCPVFIGTDRYLTAKRLLQSYRVDVIVSDDGLQHYRLAADIEVAMLDNVMGLSNRHCLPVGPLREPWHRLKKVDFIVVNLANENKQEVGEKHNLADLPFNDKKDYNIYTMKKTTRSLIKLSKNNYINLTQVKEAGNKIEKNAGEYSDAARENREYQIEEWLKLVEGKQVHAIAGIAQPQNFFNLLDEQGIEFISHRFPNHHKFSADDLNFGNDGDTKANKDKIIIMTEKDAVKCSKFTELGNLWALRISYELDASFIKKIVAKL